MSRSWYFPLTSGGRGIGYQYGGMFSGGGGVPRGSNIGPMSSVTSISPFSGLKTPSRLGFDAAVGALRPPLAGASAGGTGVYGGSGGSPLGSFVGVIDVSFTQLEQPANLFWIAPTLTFPRSEVRSGVDELLSDRDESRDVRPAVATLGRGVRIEIETLLARQFPDVAMARRIATVAGPPNLSPG